MINRIPRARSRDTSLVGMWSSFLSGSVSPTGTWLDYSGYGNNGTLVGDAYVDSIGLVLDGTGDRVDIPIDNLGTEVTVLAWCNSANTGNVRIIGADLSRFFLGLVSEQIYVYVYDASGGAHSYIPSTPKVNVNTWNMVGFTWKNNDSFNGIVNDDVQVLESGSIGSLYTGSLTTNRIGCQYNNSLYFSGGINDVRIYNRALSEPEIIQIYNQTKGFYPPPPPGFTLVTDFFTMFYAESGTTNGKPRYIGDTADSYCEWDGVDTWEIYYDDFGSVLIFSITNSGDTPPEAPANTWTENYFFTMTSLTLQ